MTQSIHRFYPKFVRAISVLKLRGQSLDHLTLTDSHLKDLQYRNFDGKSVKQAVLECYAMMATRHKVDIENALVRLQELVGQETTVREKEKVSSMLAMAAGLTMLRQAAKAKNQLRAIDRMAYKWDDGDDFERAWLMLANIHMQVIS